MSNDSMARLGFRVWGFFRHSSSGLGHSPTLTLRQRRADQTNQDAAGESLVETGQGMKQIARSEDFRRCASL
jgi:hypothetical protein